MHSERGFILHKKTAKEFEHSYKITDEMYSHHFGRYCGNLLVQRMRPRNILLRSVVQVGQLDRLEQEIADNAWLVAPASDSILFETIYEDRYPAANQLLGINPHNFVFSQVGIVNGHHGNCV